MVIAVTIHGLGAATVRCHNTDAECLGILSILEKSPGDSPAPLSLRPGIHKCNTFSERLQSLE